ncbi:MAG: hypothetical protein IT457_07750 [Planctomycetes bacterium]|nr:hypothetical protein [Planctomycetota bacterium]
MPQSAAALSAAQIAELHALLTAPVTSFDCGTLCAPGNGGVPVCCQNHTIMPVLYAAEFALLERRSRMWTRYVPQNEGERELAAELRPCELFATCKGAAHCEREHRALSCRTFPFEPYLAHDDTLCGLVFAWDLAALCPLIGSGHRIEPRFLEQTLTAFTKLFAWAPDELELWRGNSRTLRRSFARSAARISVYRPDGVFAFPTARRTWRDEVRDGRLPGPWPGADAARR